jgi:hypothetical protein
MSTSTTAMSVPTSVYWHGRFLGTLVAHDWLTNPFDADHVRRLQCCKSPSDVLRKPTMTPIV